jgi:hypothetical protein
MVIGLILIAIGVIAILVKTDVITGSIWDYVWPTALVIIGLSFVIGRFRRRRWWWFNWRPYWGDRERDRKD